MSRCTALAKATGERCRKHAIKGRKTCRVHGGRSLAGIAHPQFRTGRHSRYLVDRLAGRYEEFLSDPEILSLRSEIALVDSRTAELLEEVADGGVAWREAQEYYSQLVMALHSQDLPGTKAAVAALDVAIMSGLAEGRIWGQLNTMLNQRRLLVESERKRALEQHHVLTVERVMEMMAVILGILKERIADRKVLNLVADDIRRVVTESSDSG